MTSFGWLGYNILGDDQRENLKQQLELFFTLMCTCANAALHVSLQLLAAV